MVERRPTRPPGRSGYRYSRCSRGRADQHGRATPFLSATPRPPRRTITIWHGWSGGYVRPKQAIFAEYVKEHPDVAIKLLNVSDIGTKAQNAVPAGVGPDIIAWVDDNIGQNALVGVIDPLDGKGGIDQNYLKQNFPDVAVNAVTFNNQIYALPETLEAITFFYNKTLITADKMPKNTTELKQMMTDYNKANPGKYFAVWNPTDAYYNAPWFYGAGAQYVTTKGKAASRIRRKLWPRRNGSAACRGSCRRTSTPTWPMRCSTTARRRWRSPARGASPTCRRPTWTSGWPSCPRSTSARSGPAAPFVGVKCLMLAHGSKNPDVAVDIMKFYTSAEQQREDGQGDGRGAGQQGRRRRHSPAIRS